MVRLIVDLELEQVRAIVHDLDRTLDPVGFARLHGGVSDVYRIDVAGAENPLVLKIYADEPAWIERSQLPAGSASGRASQFRDGCGLTVVRSNAPWRHFRRSFRPAARLVRNEPIDARRS
jgi:hypothetical protein